MNENDELDRALQRLFDQASWEFRKTALDRDEGLLLSDAADGRLAAQYHGAMHDRPWQERIETIRGALGDARASGYDGTRRPVSDYFRSLYSAGGELASVLEPAPLPPALEAMGAEGQEISRVTLALAFSRSWDVRRRILAGHAALIQSGTLAAFMAALGRRLDEPPEGLHLILAAVVADARARGLDAAVSAAPECGSASNLADRVPCLFTETEARQLAIMTFLQTPTWSRRLECVRDNASLLLSEEGIEMFDLLARSYPPGHPLTRAAPAARQFLVRASADGIDTIDVQKMPPTLVTRQWISGLIGSLRSRTVAEQMSVLFSYVNFTDAELEPLHAAAANRALADVLMSEYGSGSQRAFYFEEALLHIQECLSLLTPQPSSTEDKRAARQLLGRIRLFRMRGDPSQNVEAAISLLEGLLNEVTSGPSAELVPLRILLAQAYCKRPGANPEQNRDLAAQYLKPVLTDGVRQRLPFDWANAKLAYGQLCAERLSGSKADNLAAAERNLNDALSVPGLRDKTPTVWIGAHTTLIHVYAARPTTDAAADLERALQQGKDALEVAQRETQPYYWACIQMEMGVAHIRRRAENQDAREQARVHLEAALEILTPDFPIERRHALTQLGGVYFYDRHWAKAAAAYHEATQFQDYLENDQAQTMASREFAMQGMVFTYERLAWCQLQLGDCAAALATLDQGKTRQLRKLLAQRDPGHDGSPTDAWLQAKALTTPGGSLVILLITSQGSAAFVTGPDGPERVEDAIVRLSDTTDRSLRELLEGTPGQAGWLDAYGRWLRSREHVPADLVAAEQGWFEAIDRTLQGLWQFVFEPIMHRLTELGLPVDSTIDLIPSRLLFLLPVQAARRRTPDGERFWIQDHAITVSPSLTSLAATRARLRDLVPEAPPSAMAVVDPGGDLQFAGLERAALSRQFGAAVEVLDKGALEEIKRGMLRHRYAHFACHGDFEWRDPMGSGLELAGGALLTARDVAGLQLQKTRCVVLSACESTVTDTERLQYEYAGLAGAFLQAGSPGVIASLWNVDDESTAQLMSTFYAEHIGSGAEPAQALRRAQLEVLQRAEFRHPFYWSGFQLVGG